MYTSLVYVCGGGEGRGAVVGAVVSVVGGIVIDISENLFLNSIF